MPLSSGISGQGAVGNHPGDGKAPKKGRKSSKSSSRKSQKSKGNANANAPGPTIVTENYTKTSGNQPQTRTVQVQSKCGSMDNFKHKAGGGKTKIFNQPTKYK